MRNEEVSSLPQILTQSPEASFESELPFELRALANAVNYQRWVFNSVAPYLGRSILEIGAGIGNMSQWLPVRERLILTETEPVLVEILKESCKKTSIASDSRVSVSSFDLMRDNPEIFQADRLDTIVSFNVLEHIQDDRAALKRLFGVLEKSSAKGTKRLVTFVPAHQWAYGSMDRSFGHFRRYSASDLRLLCHEIAPSARLTLRYFNSFGLLGWVLNGRILRKASIGLSSIAAFERLCPYLAPIDDFLHRVIRLPLGQSLLAVLEFDDL